MNKRTLRATFKIAIFTFIVILFWSIYRFSWINEYVTKENFIKLFKEIRESWWTPCLLLFSYVIFGLLGIPISPLIATGGVVYGIALGIVLNTLGTIISAITGYLIAKYFGYEFIQSVWGDKISNIRKILEQKNNLRYLIQIRLLPIPFTLVNYSLALSGINFKIYAVASSLGLVPSMVLYTLFFAKSYSWITTGKREDLTIAIAAIFAIVVMVLIIPKIIDVKKYPKSNNNP